MDLTSDGSDESPPGRCGYFSWTPNCLQWCHTPQMLLVCSCWFGFVQSEIILLFIFSKQVSSAYNDKQTLCDFTKNFDYFRLAPNTSRLPSVCLMLGPTLNKHWVMVSFFCGLGSAVEVIFGLKLQRKIIGDNLCL